jgi:hypothetical protein
MKSLFYKLLTTIKYILFIIYFIFEEFVIKVAKRLLAFIRKFKIYDKFIDLISQSNDFFLLASFIILAGVAESSATFAVFLTAKGFVVLGILFYIVKIIIFIPAIDIFKHNKKRLLKYTVIRTLYYWYLLITASQIYRNIKRFFKDFKERLRDYFLPIKESLTRILH